MPRKRTAIVQSSYIPWKGYFDLIRSVDVFILLDNVQFTRRDWRSRNRIKTRHGLAWLSIPVHTRGLYTQLIQDTTTSDPDWGRRHWQTIRANYAKAPYFDLYADRLAALYEHPSPRLSEINHAFITAICEMLGIATPIIWSSEYETRDAPSERLIDLCRAVGGTEYLSGPSASNYLDAAAFEAAGIAVQFADYSGYPEYSQPHGPFEHGVSVLDLLFCTGPRALELMKTL
jgi:WbqC-like protein family